MKVAYFIGSLNRGGTEVLTLDVCRHRDFAPYEIIVVYRNEGELSEEYKKTGVEMFRLKPRKWHYCKYLIDIRRLLKREKVDIIQAQTLTNGMFAVFCSLFTTVSIVTSFHGFYTSMSSWIKRKIVMRYCDALCFVSDYEKQWYVNKSSADERKCFVVYNGIDFSKFAQRFKEPDFFFKDVVDHNHPARTRLVMVGNFVSGRSQYRLLKSIYILVKSYGITDFDSYFVGKRTDSEPWLYDSCVNFVKENRLTDNVHFVGGRNDVPAILQYCDGFIYSTVHDSFGIAVVEAMAAGVPVVTNDWEVMREITQSGQWATLYKTGDFDDCARAIKELIEHIKERKMQAAMNAPRVRDKFSIERHIANQYKVYETVMVTK